MLVLGGRLAPGKRAHAAVCTGPIQLQTLQSLNSVAAHNIVCQLQDAVHSRVSTCSWQSIAEQV
jgi:hypothetical protein